MQREKKITKLFLDIGGVLLSDGWGQEFRQRAVEHFHLDADEMKSGLKTFLFFELPFMLH